MLPDEVYKRRRQHNNTPESVLLIIANYIVFAISTQIWALCTIIHWIYWAILGLLALYNFYIIRKYRDEYQKPQTIAYIFSIVGLVVLFIVFRLKATPC